MLIATKVGVPTPDGGGLSPKYITDAVERSLRRLNIDRIDLLQAHVDDNATPIEDTLAAFDRLIRAGRVRVVGASNFSASRLSEALLISSQAGLPRYQTLQPWYNLYDRDLFEGPLQDLTRSEGLGVSPTLALLRGF